MANQFLAVNEIGKVFLDVILKDTKGMTLQEQRAYFYDLQTILGGFPPIKKQRDRYIQTGR